LSDSFEHSIGIFDMQDAKDAITSLMNEYCYRIDRGDLEGFAELFTEGAFGIIGDPAGPSVGKEQTLSVLQNVILYDGKPNTMHVMTNVQIDVAANGNEATAQSYLMVFQALPPDFPMQAIFGGHYYDRFVKRRGNWRFASREISADLLGDLSRHRLDMA
jgi:hypothetical protein